MTFDLNIWNATLQLVRYVTAASAKTENIK